jgi:tRNA 2-thiouridine synthesizing protein A
MSRLPWLGRGSRPAGRHAAGSRGRAATPPDQGSAPPDAASAQAGAGPAAELPPWAADQAARADRASAAGAAGLLAAPTMADFPSGPRWPQELGPQELVSPVTDAARAAAASSAAWLPTYVPPGAAPTVTIDALGRKCPIPIIMLAQQIGDVPVGAVIAVLADDPAAYSDIPAWCALKSHDCVFRADHATGWSFGIRRRY